MNAKSRMMLGVVAAASIAIAPNMAAAKEAKKPADPIVIPPPPAGKGQIVFFRPGGMGLVLGCSVNEKGGKISSLGAGKYFVMVTDPGRHEFTVKSEAKDVLALEVESDETQYAKCRIKMGIMVGRPDLAPATEAEFRDNPKLDLVDADDMGPAPGALRPEELEAARKAMMAPAAVAAPAEPAITSEPAPAVAPEAAPAAPAAQ